MMLFTNLLFSSIPLLYVLNACVSYALYQCLVPFSNFYAYPLTSFFDVTLLTMSENLCSFANPLPRK